MSHGKSIQPFLQLSMALAAASLLGGCTVVEGIFKAGVWVGVLVVVLFFGVIGGALALIKR